ncbi:cell wall protein DAN4-like [Chelmon rostratus]|uniref:cell wall protein DAN4-like n=1 Tax=Chelmon rostratus TaxID=109905 RepID=UPI001BE68509|nr:cell wall protein DAN4-like [Chelmon rostratus]XP_041816323.1 cell wall protein DAN4-like [Chelmon rostratus]
MLPLSVKMYLALLWGTFVLFSVESMGTPIPDPSMNSTAGPSETSEPPISAHVAHNEAGTQPGAWYPTHKPAKASVSATAQTTVPPAVETEEGAVTHSSDSSYDSMTALVATNAAAATAGPRLLHTATAVTTAAGEARPSNSMTISGTATPAEGQFHQQSATTSNATTSAASLTTESSSWPTSTTQPAEGQFHQQSATTSNATTSAASLTTESPSRPTSTTQPEATSKLSSAASPAHPTQTSAFIENLSSPSASPASAVTANSTSEAALVFDPTASPVTTSETSATSTQHSAMSQHASVPTIRISTLGFTDPGGSRSTAEPPAISSSTDPANTTPISTSPTGIFIPHVPKRLPIPTAKSTPATAATPREVSKSPPSGDVQPCSTRGVVKHCLIAIASLAGLATIFMVSTIILCTKLSARKYKVKPQPATEMMCISALLPERIYTYSRQRSPVTNGVLVMHGGGDSDEEGGDNLTLSSFLPENERSV